MGCGASKHAHGVHTLVAVVPGAPPPLQLAAGFLAAARKANVGEGEALAIVAPSGSANVTRARIEGVEARFRDAHNTRLHAACVTTRALALQA